MRSISQRLMPLHSGAIQWKYSILALCVLLIVWAFTSYNGLIGQRENVSNAWNNVQTQEQRRFDLVPNLVATVKGAANFEESTFTAITQARSQWQGAAGNRTVQVGAAQSLDGALSKLIVTVEAYPQLQATQAFRDLMTQLEGTENRISVARKDYNDAVKHYNIRVQTFPGVLMAKLFGFATEQGFQESAGASSAPAVNFGQ